MKEKMKTDKLPIPVKTSGAFILINHDRILKSAIKRYVPNGDRNINVYFNISTFKSDYRTYNLNSKQQQTKILNYLDSIYL